MADRGGIIERVGIIIKGVAIIIKGIVVIERVATFPETRLRHFPFYTVAWKVVESCRGFRKFREFRGWALEYGSVN